MIFNQCWLINIWCGNLGGGGGGGGWPPLPPGSSAYAGQYNVS